jgi:hypothetical protein
MSNNIIPVIAVWALSTNHGPPSRAPPTKLSVPKIFDLIKDPTEEYGATLTPDAWVVGPRMKIVGEFEASLKKFPPARAWHAGSLHAALGQITTRTKSSHDRS